MDLKKQLSNKFTLGDVVRSQTATRFNFVEQFNPPQQVIDNATALCQHVLDKIPFAFVISSFYRCPRLNTQIGGSKTSDHVLGRSVDIDSMNNANNGEIFHHIKNNLEFDQLIWEFGNDIDPDWVHVSFRAGANRKQVLRAIKENGKTKYINVK